ncbi:hypothetical protein CR513_30664, partial [Mucuna pruriens]
MGEKELIISTPTPTRYIEGEEEALETSFQSLKVTGTTHTKPGNLSPSRVEIMAARDDNAILEYEDPNQTNKPVEDGNEEVEALPEMERCIEQERPKFQPLTEDLEGINLGDETERKEVWVGKQMPPDLRIGLIKHLREYTNVFAWSCRDMSGLDHKTVKHKLPLLLDSVLVRQQL